MNERKSILTTRKYGYIKLNLKARMDELSISRNSMARSVNTRFEVIDKWYAGNVEKIDLDILARICFVLDCKVEDIMEYCYK